MKQRRSPRRRPENGAPDPNRLRERRLAAGLSQQALADKVNTTKQTISKLEKGEIRLDVGWMQVIAPHLGVAMSDLLPPNHAAPIILPGDQAALPAHLPSIDRDDVIPIRSAGRGGSDQEMFLGDGPLGFITRPRSLLGVRGAYAIYMLGDSMEPRYEQGWLLHVNPIKPPSKGRDVVVTCADNTVYVKQFVGWQAGHLVLRQYNPPDAPLIRIPRDNVVDCHLIVGADQES